jgi:transcriptional regulator with XRE-family HTH domain
MSTLRNPFLDLRRSRAMSVREFADALALSVAEIREVEAGHVRRPRRVLDALARLGFDADEIKQQYDDWLASEEARRRAAARAKLAPEAAR